MDIISSIILGAVQGLTEFLPISSSGHLILARDILRLQTENGLAVDAVLQLATVLAVGIYFYRELIGLVATAGRLLLGRSVTATQRTLLAAIVIGTVPAIFFGLLLEDIMATAFRSALLVVVTLLVGSGLMLFAELLARRRIRQQLTWKRGLIIGLFQCLALVPGISRSGSTISGGLLAGLNRALAAKFSFLLSFPIIAGTGLKKLFDLSTDGTLVDLGPGLIIAFLTAFFIGLAAIHFLLRFLRQHTLLIFIVYRVVLAISVFVVLLMN
ncbi:undecaprenyl-diphosphatase UppP [Patescibacteria group bacterium]|nr:undecaprenyl-diphosphatase UppP [Patescibacteria group bacterium]MBU1915872.1 undecaprenyl-diphosphatase UppP [Patescibacteria group bacterium]